MAEKQWMPAAGFVAGLTLYLLAYNVTIAETRVVEVNFEPVEISVPDARFVGAGWLLMAFCLMHFYPRQLLKSLLGRHAGWTG